MKLTEILGINKKTASPCLIHIPIDRLVPNPLQPRRIFDEEELRKLSLSIRQNGIIQPICVRYRENTPEISLNGQTVRAKAVYEIIAGERRWRASKLAGLKTVPCMLITATAGESAQMALAENAFRNDLDFFEQAAAMQNIMMICDITQAELAESLGLSQPTVANKLRLLKYGEEERRIIRKSRMPERQARCFLRIADSEKRLRLLCIAAENGYTVEECELLVENCFGRPQRTGRQKKKGATQKLVGTVSDIRFFINSVDKAISLASAAGFSVEREENDKGDYVEICLKIPKSRMAG